MKKILIAACLTLFAASQALAQAKKPTIMVVPSNAWCNTNGYSTTETLQGNKRTIPDYAAALDNDIDLIDVLAKIGELMTERGFNLKDLQAQMGNLTRTGTENEFTTSKAGSTIAETPLDRLVSRAKADIVVDLTWKINKTGPKSSVTYILKGLDAYTGKAVATSSGTGAPSLASEVPVLLEEAVVDKMDGFCSQLQAHFEDMAEKGRETILEIRVFDDGSGKDLETEYNGEVLQDIIENWVEENTVQHRFSLTDVTEDMMLFEQVRIPLLKESGAGMDMRSFTQGLTRYLTSTYGIKTKLIAKGLGKVVVVIGE